MLGFLLENSHLELNVLIDLCYAISFFYKQFCIYLNTLVCFRTFQTAVGTFGGEGYKDGVNTPLLMTAGAGNSDRPAISRLNRPPFIAVESCREHLVCLLFYLLHEWHFLEMKTFPMFLVQGVHPCDRRSNITKYRELFPAIDFSLAST